MPPEGVAMMTLTEIEQAMTDAGYSVHEADEIADSLDRWWREDKR